MLPFLFSSRALFPIACDLAYAVTQKENIITSKTRTDTLVQSIQNGYVNCIDIYIHALLYARDSVRS